MNLAGSRGATMTVTARNQRRKIPGVGSLQCSRGATMTRVEEICEVKPTVSTIYSNQSLVLFF